MIFSIGPVTGPQTLTTDISVAPATGLATLFLVGLFGSVHCLGMCGPLVGVYAERIRKNDARRSGREVLTTSQIRQHLLFNLGRTVGYTAVGSILGAVGMFTFDAAAVVGVGDVLRSVVGIAVGVFVVVMGLRYLSGRTGESFGSLPVLGIAFSRVSSRLLTHVDRWVHGPSITGLGLVHALLPCPMLYPVYLYAFASGSPRIGALSLAALGLGTFPALFLTGTVFGTISPARRRHLHRLLGGVFLLLGGVLLTKSIQTLGIEIPLLRAW